VVLYITFDIWNATQNLWALFIPNVMFVYWVVLITFVVAKGSSD